MITMPRVTSLSEDGTVTDFLCAGSFEGAVAFFIGLDDIFVAGDAEAELSFPWVSSAGQPVNKVSVRQSINVFFMKKAFQNEGYWMFSIH